MVHISVSSLGGVHRIGGRICSYLEASVGVEQSIRGGKNVQVGAIAPHDGRRLSVSSSKLP
jgi:hypothetical protein